ncbi:hypothetical protein [Bradyrhizobium sp. USDA 3315]
MIGPRQFSYSAVQREPRAPHLPYLLGDETLRNDTGDVDPTLAGDLSPRLSSAAATERAGQQAGNASAQATSPAHSPTASDAGSSATETKVVRANERCDASSFVQARAQLAATLAGANVGELMSEIRQAEQRTAQWTTPNGPRPDTVDGDRILSDVVGSSYLQLQRFQDHAGHCRPLLDVDQTGIAHVRDSRLRPEYTRRQFLARMAAGHTRGNRVSPFVSLCANASRLLASPDPTAREITRSARRLCTYTVPRAMVWTPEGIISVLVQGDCDDLRYDAADIEWLSGTPTRESEVLFLGGNLDEYQTASGPNPHRIPEPRGSI